MATVLAKIDRFAQRRWELLLWGGLFVNMILGWFDAHIALRVCALTAVALGWILQRWSDPMPWWGHFSAYPPEPSLWWQNIAKWWVRFFAVLALLGLIVSLATIPIPSIDSRYGALGVTCALILSHIAVLRDTLYEWKLWVIVVGSLSIIAWLEAPMAVKFGLVLLTCFTPVVMRYFNLSKLFAARDEVILQPHPSGDSQATQLRR